MLSARELQRCRAAGAQGRAGSPLPAALLERTRSVLPRRRERSDAPYHQQACRVKRRGHAGGILPERGSVSRSTSIGQMIQVIPTVRDLRSCCGSQTRAPGESAVAARLWRRSPR
jgi:hypothetical protein